jgi:hypothetical protein
MSKVYKIHPAIGICRVGNSLNEFFIGPESLDRPPTEISNNNETPLTKYKDSSGRVKRQAARFRVYEYDQDVAGNLGNPREITSQEAKIEWKVEIANNKGAAPKLDRPDANGIPPATSPRNGNLPPVELIIAPVFSTISGVNQHLNAQQSGKFLNKEVFLGELMTDSAGRLIVLGGRGLSASVPPGQPIGNFANNPLWHDDVSDGPVTAEIAFAGQPARKVDASAWVIVAPPDFAPHIKGLTTLYDIAFQAAHTRGWLAPPDSPSFRRDIFPILLRASDLRWVNQFDLWNTFPRDWSNLSDSSNTSANLRKEVFDLLMSIGSQRRLDSFRFTAVQNKFLTQWRDGNFTDDFAAPVTPVTDITPGNLDRSALENAVGGGFFPGIEAGIKLTYAEIYEEPFRLTRNAYQHLTWQEKLKPGSISERMAVPWQADFLACAGNWWPAQRPDDVISDTGEDIPSTDWDRNINGFDAMVNNFSKLGFIIEKRIDNVNIYIETERDPNF